jgi:hypothetical protein
MYRTNAGYGAGPLVEPTTRANGAQMPNLQISPFWAVASTMSMAASAYHGYRRNSNGAHPVAWALTWGILGAMFPVIVPFIAVAEGFGKPE